MSQPLEPPTSPADQSGQWPPPIDVPAREAASLASKPKLSLAILVSVTDTIGLFFVWGISSVVLSDMWSKGYSGAPARFVLDTVMPCAIGLAASYRWRLLAFRLVTQLLYLCVDIVVLTVCSSTLLAGLMGLGGNPLRLAAHPGAPIAIDRIEAGVAAIVLVVVGSLVGRVLFAPKVYGEATEKSDA